MKKTFFVLALIAFLLLVNPVSSYPAMINVNSVQNTLIRNITITTSPSIANTASYPTVKVTKVQIPAIDPSVFEDMDATPVVSVTSPSSTYNVNSNFTITVSATDDKALLKIRLMLSDGWHDYACNKMKTCQNTWSTKEAAAGTYSYSAMAVDNATKAEVKSIAITISNSCVENWVKKETACQTNDKKQIMYEDSNKCGTTINRPADYGTYASCDYCSLDITNATSACAKTDSYTVTYSDKNFCYSKTGLDSDEVPATETKSCDYCTPNWQESAGQCKSDDTKVSTYTDSNGCFAKTGLSSDNNKPADKVISCDFCTPNLIEHIGQCMTNDSLIKWYSDPVNCYSQTGLPSDKVPDDQYISCDYCTPNWQESIGICLNNDTKIGTFSDANACYASTGLVSDNNKPANKQYSCDFCTPNIQSSTGSCRIDDTKLKHYTDSNVCFVQTGLPADQIPSDETLSCDYCAPNWQPSYSSCMIDDKKTVSYSDSNSCFAQTGLPSDNNKPADENISCDYCAPNIQTFYTSCSIYDNKTKYFTDSNACFAQTGLFSDKVPANETVSCDFCTPNIQIDSISCSITDTNYTKYSDLNNCYSQTSLPSDKIPDNVTGVCDYCTPNWQPQNTSCVNHSLTTYYVDSNSCFAQTGLSSDNNQPANETSYCGGGQLVPYLITPLDNDTTLVNQTKNIAIKTGVKCIGGPCKNVVATLDPQLKADLTKIKKPSIILSDNLITNVKEKPRTVIIVFKDDNVQRNLANRMTFVRNNQDSMIKKLVSDGSAIKIKAKYQALNAMAIEADEKTLQKLIDDDNVEAIYEDWVGKMSTDQAKGTLGINPLNIMQINGKNITGAGYSICIIDSGIRYNHSAFGGGGFPNSKVVGGYDYCADNGACNTQDSDPWDVMGHGTKISGIAAGNDPNNGFKGAAPDATIVAVKIFNSSGFYKGTNAYWAMDWCLKNKDNYSIAAVSMSFGDAVQHNSTNCPSGPTGDAPLPLGTLSRSGLINVAASGNEWFNNGQAYPACSAYAIGVGAMDDGRAAGLNNTITNFTNIGAGTNFLLAPGRWVNTAAFYNDNAYESCTGTSCSTPLISGGVVLIQQYLKEKYNRTIDTPKMYQLLNSTGRTIGVEDGRKSSVPDNYTLPSFVEAVMKFENAQSKGVVSTTAGAKPFYTTSANPQSCGDMAVNQTCESTWNVYATGTVGTYEFFTIYSSDEDSQNTTKFNVTII